MNILALDSSGLAASAALVTEENVLGEFFINYKKTHSQTLMPLVENMLKALDFDRKNIDYIAITCGPGSFTGLRIGMAAAKGLAAALDIPIIPVPTLDVIAYNMAENGGIAVPVMDARRSQVYYSIYKAENGELKRLADYGAKDITEVTAEVLKISKDAVFLGDGTAPYEKQITEAGFKICGSAHSLQRASAAGVLAAKAVKEGKIPENTDLIYLRKSQAERELEERQKKEKQENQEKQDENNTSEKVSFRLMTKADIDSVAEVERKSFPTPWSKKMIEEDFKNGLSYYIICEKGGKVIGYAGMWHVINEGHITNVAIIPKEQGRGYGRLLMNELIRLAKEKEMIEIFLEVRVSNKKAISLYEKLGFIKEGVRPEYYSDTKESALLMSKNLLKEVKSL